MPSILDQVSQGNSAILDADAAFNRDQQASQDRQTAIRTKDAILTAVLKATNIDYFMGMKSEHSKLLLDIFHANGITGLVSSDSHAYQSAHNTRQAILVQIALRRWHDAGHPPTSPAEIQASTNNNKIYTSILNQDERDRVDALVKVLKHYDSDPKSKPYLMNVLQDVVADTNRNHLWLASQRIGSFGTQNYALETEGMGGAFNNQIIGVIRATQDETSPPAAPATVVAANGAPPPPPPAAPKARGRGGKRSAGPGAPPPPASGGNTRVADSGHHGTPHGGGRSGPPAADGGHHDRGGVMLASFHQGDHRVGTAIGDERRFDTGKYALSTDDQKALDGMIAQFKSALDGNPQARLQIVGHTDPSGGDRVNIPLSQRRAQVVADYLQHHGISSDRIVTVGAGSSQPRDGVAPTDASNRRVSFSVVKPDSPVFQPAVNSSADGKPVSPIDASGVHVASTDQRTPSAAGAASNDGQARTIPVSYSGSGRAAALNDVKKGQAIATASQPQQDGVQQPATPAQTDAQRQAIEAKAAADEAARLAAEAAERARIAAETAARLAAAANNPNTNTVGASQSGKPAVIQAVDKKPMQKPLQRAFGGPGHTA